MPGAIVSNEARDQNPVAALTVPVSTSSTLNTILSIAVIDVSHLVFLLLFVDGCNSVENNQLLSRSSKYLPGVHSI